MRRSKMRSVFLLLSISFYLSSTLIAQDVEAVTDSLKNFSSKSVKVTGGLSASNTWYFVNGINPRKDALQWLLHANLNINIAGFNIPFSATFSEGNKEFNLPSFLIAGISPRYKWATLHLGDRSLNYSKYTLSGHNFFGVGTELAPKKFYFSAMYGRLKRAVAEDLVSQQSLDPSFRRMGLGFKSGYKDRNNELSVILFKAYDLESSLALNPIEQEVLPGDNTILSVIGRKKLGKHFSIDGEYARSAFSRDKRSDLLTTEDKNAGNTMLGLHKARTSSSYKNAVKGGVQFSTGQSRIRLDYERIDPEFKTMGSLFFNNDIEDITASVSSRILKGKMSFNVHGGIERNNIQQKEVTGNIRAIGSLNIAYNPNAKLGFAAGYSNFRNTTKLKAQADPFNLVDSIFLAQVTQNASFSANYNMGKENGNPSSITLILSHQTANSIENDIVLLQTTRFYNGNLIYNYRFINKDMTIGASFNGNNSIVPMSNTLAIAPAVSLYKGFFEQKLQTTFQTSYSFVYTNSLASAQVLNFGVGVNYNFLKNHVVSLNTALTNRFPAGTVLSNFIESSGTLAYFFRF